MSIVFFGIVGTIISYPSKQGKVLLPYLLFPYLVKGFLFVISLYAIWITKGKTILLLVPVLLLIAGYFEKPILTEAQPVRGNFKAVIIFILSASVLYFIYYSQAFLTGSDVVKYAGGDTSFYARAAYNLNINGIENARIEYLYPERFNPEPYHYYDLWFAAFLSKVTGINTHWIYVLIVYPFLSIVFVFGIWAFCKKYFKNPAVTAATIFAGLFAGFKLFYPYFIIDGDVYDTPPSFWAKTCFTGCAIIYSMIALQRLNWIDLMVTAALFAVGYMNLAPGFAFSVLVLTMIGLRAKQISFKSIAVADSLLFIQGLYFYYFYRSSSGADRFGGSMDTAYFQQSFKIILSGLTQFFILTPFLLLLLLQYPKPWNIVKATIASKPLLFLILLPVTGIISWGLFWGIGQDSVQFFYNTFIPAAAISISLILLKSIKSPKLIFRVLGIVAVVFLVLKNYKYGYHIEKVNKQDIAALTDFKKKYEPGLFANIKGPGEFQTIFDKHTNLSMPLLWAAYLDNAYQNYSLNTTLIKNDPSIPYYLFEKKALEDAPFSYFARQKNLSGNGDDLQKDFIIHNKIKYLTVSPLADLDKKYSSMFQDSIKLSTGWRVYKLIY